jgi:hypothetical protein
VADDVENLKSDIDNMHDDVKSTSDASTLDRDVHDLRVEFAQFHALDPSLLPDDAPTKDELDAAIRAARRKVRVQGRAGADFGAAQSLLDKAEAIKAQADAARQAHGG